MPSFFEMPQASPTMEKGRIVAWRKAEGDALVPQDVIAEVETDKATMEVEVFDAGYLLRILAAEGEEVPAGRPIAILGKSPDEDVSALLAEFERLKEAAPPAGPPAPSAEEGPAPAPAAPAKPSEPAPAKAPAEPAATPGLRPFTWMGRPVDPAIMEPPEGFEPPSPAVRAAPAARRAARELGVDLASVRGSGPHGRVLRADVEAAARPAPAPASRAEPEAVPHSTMRAAIARRLKEAWLDAPVFYLSVTYDADALVAFRGQLKAAGRAVSYNDILVKAVALALREVPEVNATWTESAVLRHRRVDIGVAVALPDGLITPVIREADRKGLSAIAEEARALAERARARKLDPSEYTGATFTISNLGMMGIDWFTAIQNPPEAAILAVGALRREPVVTEAGELAVGWRLRATMTCDHRVIDGALGARFLAALRRLVENPALLAG